MTRRRMEGLLWSSAVLIAALSLAAWMDAPAMHSQSPDVATAFPALPLEPIDPDALDKAADAIARNDPFRFEHQPSGVPYTVQAEGAAPPPPAPPKPKIALVGIIGGPPWEALVEGIPGRDGSVVVRQGETIGALQFTSIRRDTVVVRGADTTWKLTLRRAW